MTEAEWLTSANPPAMLGPLQLRPSDRKLRLVVLGWWYYVDVFRFRELRGEPRTAWELRCELLVTYLVRFVDGHASWAAVRAVRQLLNVDRPDLRYAGNSFAYDFLSAAADDDAWRALVGSWRVLQSDDEHAEYFDFLRCEQLREVIGNPFRPVAFAPEWRTSKVALIAQNAYDTGDFSALPILADALQDAGCNSDELLNHLRDPNATHVRGCWALDLVLGKS